MWLKNAEAKFSSQKLSAPLPIVVRDLTEASTVKLQISSEQVDISLLEFAVWV